MSVAPITRRGLGERLERRDPELAPTRCPGEQQGEGGRPRGRRRPQRAGRGARTAAIAPARAAIAPRPSQRAPRREPVEEAHRDGCPGARAGEVRRVDAREAIAEHDEGAANPGRGRGRREWRGDLDDEQPAERPERPGKLQHVEGNALGRARSRPGRRGANARAASARKKGSGGDPDPAARHHQEGAARPEPEEGGADHQEREVVPLDDREQPGEEDLVAESGQRRGAPPPPAGGSRDRGGEPPAVHRLPWPPGVRSYRGPPVRGTNRTGRTWRTLTFAVRPLAHEEEHLHGEPLSDRDHQHPRPARAARPGAAGRGRRRR